MITLNELTTGMTSYTKSLFLGTISEADLNTMRIKESVQLEKAYADSDDSFEDYLEHISGVNNDISDIFAEFLATI